MKKLMILAIGNELLNGDSLDTNSNYLSKELQSFSMNIERVSQVPDNLDVIVEEIQKGVRDFDFLIIMGGLGPTEDDLTRFAISKALNRKLLQNLEELEIIKNKLSKFSRIMSPNNEKQTFFPEGSQILDNPIGTASGFYIQEKICHIFVLPGVPTEMKALYRDKIVPILNNLIPNKTQKKRLVVKIMGMGESGIDKKVVEEIIPYYNLNWEINVKKDGVYLKFYPKEEQKDEQWKDKLYSSLCNSFDYFLYGKEEEYLNSIIAKLLVDTGLTFGTVESCTGGYISKYITELSGSSDFFLGTIVTYSNDLKIKLAQVDSKILEHHGAVSSETAQAMAQGGKRVLGIDLCLSVTGIAGPTGGTEEKPVGLVWFGLEDQHGKVISKKHFFYGNREDVRTKALYFGLNLVRLSLLDKLDEYMSI